MEEIILHHKAAIAGTVNDKITKQPIADVLVEIVSQNLHVYTSEDGFFYFNDLPNGQYTLKFSIPKNLKNMYGIEVVEKTVTVQTEQKGIYVIPIIDPANVQLSPTRLMGKVKNNDQNIVNALVQLFSSQVQTETDKEGGYIFSGIEAGKQTIRVYFKGSQVDKRLVTLTAGQDNTEDFNLKL